MQFEDFWKLYPRKVAKLVAKRIWGRLSIKDRNIIFIMLPQHLLRWKDKELQYIPHASTWLNQRRFEDELEPLPKKELTSGEKEQIKMNHLKKEWEEAEKNAASPEEIKAALGLHKKNGSNKIN